MNSPYCDDQLTIEELQRGIGMPWLLVIDDFLRDPDAMRQHALTLPYDRAGNFPGLNSTQKIPLPGLTQAVSQIVGEPLHAPWSPTYAHESCRLSLASDSASGRVHIDTSHWTGVLSLSRDEDSASATEFYRHKRSGTTHLPLTPAELAASGYSNYQELDADILQKDALDPAQWDQVMSVPLRYNRLILLQPHYWHTAGPGFGESVENARLVYLMFFNRLPQGRVG